MINLSTVKWLQVEATSKCNAWCPGCSRNNDGYGLSDDFVVQDLKTERFKEVLDLLPNLETIDFCGTFGDAIAAANIIELTELTVNRVSKVMIRTNGSLRSESWWADYAKLLSPHQHDVWFCLDGLEDTHHIYRQGTDYHKIIKNARAFIEQGGYATWQFIPYAHNEHQIKDCIKLSQELGFKKFEFLKKVRHSFTPRDYRTGETYTIRPWSKDSVINPLTFARKRVDPKNCMHLEHPSIYLNADGRLNVCCFFNQIHATFNTNEFMDVPALLADTKSTPATCFRHCGSQ